MEEYRREKRMMTALTLCFALMMSVPYLIPHMGWLSLLGLVPLLCMERIGTICGIRRLWRWHYAGFVLWNAFTTFWVCNATVGGGIFAILANSLQMSLVFGAFRLSRKVFRGTLPYIFFAALWIAWEKAYFSAQISWPWLTLGNSFARTLSLAQWYEFTGTLGGSLWIWASNLAVFGLMCCLSDGSFSSWNPKARAAALLAEPLILIIPAAISLHLWKAPIEEGDKIEVAILQPDIDPYHKFQRLSQSQQNAILEEQMRQALSGRDSSCTSPLLLLAPETFTNDVNAGDIKGGKTWNRFRNLLEGYPGVTLLFGASSIDIIESADRPSYTARPYGEGIWLETHNSALTVDGSGHGGIFHKNKLVVGVEMTPYPAFFCKIDDMLGGVMGRNIGQGEVSLLELRSPERNVRTGCAICYESIYGDYCREYVKAGAELMTVITNDAWWGDTPGYRQHLSYASLRAIELRRDIVRCANTGISALIDKHGRITAKTHWWEKEILRGEASLGSGETFFVRNGDIAGRICTLVAALLALALLTRLITVRKNG